MEYEDALQELYITLLETLPYLDCTQTEWKCLTYMKKAVINRYYALCKHYLSIPQTENLDTVSAFLESPSSFDDTYYDIVSYINSFPVESLKYKILALYFYDDKTDTEIAVVLKVSRQYVHRIKKKLVRDYFSS